jgi:hypothetical protein
MLPIFFYHNAAQSLAHKGFRRIVTPPAPQPSPSRSQRIIIDVKALEKLIEMLRA